MNGEEYDSRYLPELAIGEKRTLQFFYSAYQLGSYNLTCEIWDNGMKSHSMGRRIVIQDLGGPTFVDDNTTAVEEENKDFSDIIMWAGLFMIVIAVIIQIVGKRARDGK